MNILITSAGFDSWQRQGFFCLPLRPNLPTPPRAEVKNTWCYTSTPPHVFIEWRSVEHRISLHGVVLG